VMTTLSARAPQTPDHARETRMREDRLLLERFAERRDPIDRELLVERFLPLARRLAARHLRHNEPFEDVFQVACLGLIKAIDRFDAGRGRAFSSFALPTIVGEIKRHYRDRTWAMHVPRDRKDLALAARRAADELEVEKQRRGTVAEIADRLAVDEERVVDALLAGRAQHPDSLDAPMPGGDEPGATVGDGFGADEQGYDRAENRALLGGLLRTLSPRELLVLHLSFERDLTQAEIGARVGLSQMQICRMLRRSIGKCAMAYVRPLTNRACRPTACG
jgi:RNA polymerase sigma-B factor